MKAELSVCPDCGVKLPPVDGPRHRYIGASAACWALFAALNNAGEPPLASGKWNGLITDAYAAQHPGTPSPQAIQSVAVHVLALYGVIERGRPHGQAQWLRLRALDERYGPKRGRFHWLTPPDLTKTEPLTSITTPSTPAARTAAVEIYVKSVLHAWQAAHEKTIAGWYEQFIGLGAAGGT